MVRDGGHNLVVRSVGDSIKHGRVRLRTPDEPRNPHQSVTLLDAIAEFGFDACIGGARRDEEKARAKERVFSFRDEFGQWDPKNQRPGDVVDLQRARPQGRKHPRVPHLQLDRAGRVAVHPARGDSAPRASTSRTAAPIIRRKESLVPVTDITPPRAGEVVEELLVRFRTVGDITCTAPVDSAATTIDEIVRETELTAITERGATRLDDQANEAAMELRKREGYF